MTKLYTFGCSFTQYMWPTWADILGQLFDEYENHGLSGAGNELMFHTIVEILNTRELSNTTILICWSSYPRVDLRKNSEWKVGGNMFSREDLPKSVAEFIFNEEGLLYKNINYIYAVCNLLELNNIKWKMMFMTNLLQPVVDQSVKGDIDHLHNYFKALVDRYKDNIILQPLAEFSSDQDPVFFKTAPWGNNVRDAHPTPLTHLRFVQKFFPEYKLTQQAVHEVLNMERKIRQIEHCQLLYDWWTTHEWFLKSKKIQGIRAEPT